MAWRTHHLLRVSSRLRSLSRTTGTDLDYVVTRDDEDDVVVLLSERPERPSWVVVLPPGADAGMAVRGRVEVRGDPAGDGLVALALGDRVLWPLGPATGATDDDLRELITGGGPEEDL